MKYTDNPNYHKEWRLKNPEYGKEHYQKNKDKYLIKVNCEYCNIICYKGNLARHQKSHLCSKNDPKPPPLPHDEVKDLPLPPSGAD